MMLLIHLAHCLGQHKFTLPRAGSGPVVQVTSSGRRYLTLHLKQLLSPMSLYPFLFPFNTTRCFTLLSLFDPFRLLA